MDTSVDYTNDPAYADHKTGIAEVYGFDIMVLKYLDYI